MAIRATATRRWAYAVLAAGLICVGLLIWGNYNVPSTGLPGKTSPLPQLPDAKTKDKIGAPFAAANEASLGNPTALLPGAKQARLEALAKPPPAEILPVWKDVFLRRDAQQAPLVVAAMGQSLRHAPDAAVYHALAATLADARLSVEERLAALDTLGYAATPDAISIVLDYLLRAEKSGDPANANDPTLTHARETIRRIADTLIDGARNWPVVSQLINAWHDPGIQSSSKTLIVVADALRYLASPKAAQALLETQMRANPDSPSARAAGVAISRFTAPDVVDVLGAALAKSDTSTTVQRSLVAGLVSVGNQNSINYLMGYLNLPNSNRKLTSNEIQALMIAHRYSPEALKAMRSWQGNLQGTNSPARPVLDAILQKASTNKP